MTPLINFAILVLATWRLASILQRELIMEKVRNKVFGETYNTLLNTYTYPDTFLGHLIQCFMCVSVWTGLLCSIVYVYDPRFLLPLAASAVAIALDKVIS